MLSAPAVRFLGRHGVAFVGKRDAKVKSGQFIGIFDIQFPQQLLIGHILNQYGDAFQQVAQRLRDGGERIFGQFDHVFRAGRGGKAHGILMRAGLPWGQVRFSAQGVTGQKY